MRVAVPAVGGGSDRRRRDSDHEGVRLKRNPLFQQTSHVDLGPGGIKDVELIANPLAAGYVAPVQTQQVFAAGLPVCVRTR